MHENITIGGRDTGTMQQQEITQQWRHAALMLGLAFLTVIVVLFDTVSNLVMTWWDKPEYNHCLLILPIIAYLIHERREVFLKIAPKPSWLGHGIIVAGGGLWLLGDLADANVVRQFGLVILIQGICLAILGPRVVRAFLFPLAYMIFLIPFGDFLVPALQDYTTAFVVTTLNIIDIPVFVEGVFLSIPAGDFHVAEACAGLRFLVATVALGTLMANVAYKTLGRQVLVVILSFLVPVIANGFRASGIVLVAHWSDMKYATGVDHIVFGWIFFAIVLLIFISIAMTFTNRGLNDGYVDFSKAYWTNNESVPVRKFAPFFIAGILLVGLGPLYVSLIEQRYTAYDSYTVQLESETWGDPREDANWKPFYKNASQEFHLGKSVPDAKPADVPTDVYLGYYKYQTSDVEMIRHGNDVAQNDKWERASTRSLQTEIDGAQKSVNEVVLQSRGGKRLVWYWYWVDGKIITSKYMAKLYEVKAKILGGRLDAAVVALSVPFDNDSFVRRQAQLAKLAATLPPLGNIVASRP